MKLRTDAEYAALIAGIDEGFRAIEASLNSVFLAREAGVLSPPAAARIRDTTRKDLLLAPKDDGCSCLF
ncbi:hypothetical protein T484DRAFT_1886723 [Baffinella frigidus]|nr:hypothetical protein T484DRAFT_1886723 [Cryptophyta sp. CCMP2293]